MFQTYDCEFFFCLKYLTLLLQLQPWDYKEGHTAQFILKTFRKNYTSIRAAHNTMQLENKLFAFLPYC